MGCFALVFLLDPVAFAGAQSRADGDAGGANVALNILYTSDIKGHVEPCG